jgi:tetratricopeptide (TPR) repeat protein
VRFAILCALLASHARAGESLAEYETRLKAVLKLSPDSFAANYNLGELYLHAGRLLNGIPYMEKAQALQPAHYTSGYDLALAYFETRNYMTARRHIRGMLNRADSAELHSLLADVEEAAGDYLTAAEEYQRAARMEPSEEHIFAWGSELLTHQTYAPATTVFRRGIELYPPSARLQAGLGIALYLSGKYDEAVRALCAATDLEASQSWPYLFLGRIYNTAGGATEEVRRRLARFAQMQPKNAQALYYYAMALWRRGQDVEADLTPVESLLKLAVAQDPSYADAHFQLGILFADQRKNAEAIVQFQRAIALQPNMTTAHYHLAQAYARGGEKARAAQELQVFDRLRKQDQVETEKERKEVRQFIVDMKEQAAAAR